MVICEEGVTNLKVTKKVNKFTHEHICEFTTARGVKNQEGLRIPEQ